MAMERTLIIVKPDGVQRGLAGEIIARFERKGFRLVGMKFMQAPRDLVEEHYAAHRGKNFFDGVVSYMASSPVVVIAFEGTNAIAAARGIVGATKPHEAAPGSIRGDFGLEVGRNLVHASDGTEAAEREIALWFTTDELVNWARNNDAWIFEQK